MRGGAEGGALSSNSPRGGEPDTGGLDPTTHEIPT